MSRVPLWMRLLRWNSLHTPFRRGTYRAALWFYQHLPIPDLEVETLLDQTLWVTLHLPTWVDYNIYTLGLYEAPLARLFINLLRPDSVVLDIGAYIGQYTLLAAKYAPDGHVVAFEPHPESCRRLQAHITRNRLANVTTVPQAAWKQPGRLSFALRSESSTSGLLPSGQQEGAVMEVEAVTVDDVICKAGLPRVDLIKVDVEGAEGQVLRGAQETLTRYHPLLIVEMDKRTEQAFGDDPETLRRELENLCYTLYILRRHRLIPINNQLGDYENVIAIPAEKRDNVICSVCDIYRRNL